MRLLAAALSLLALLPAAAAAQGSAPDAGTPFEPRAVSQPVYDKATSTVGAFITARDGQRLFVETWLPAARQGQEAPARWPVVLIATPYVKRGVERYPTRNDAPVIEWFNQRGYAVAQHHIRGTGLSEGCLEQTSDLQIDDVARVIEHLGTRPWSTGKVGMYGHSYDAETQVSTAGRGDKDKTKYLKAIVPSASVGGQYEYSHFDGVPYAGQAALSNAGYFALTSLTGTEGDVQYARRAECVPELGAASIDPRGDMTTFWRKREYRPEADLIDAATLWVHGLQDRNVQAITVSAFFDRLPASTPKAGLFGQWEHNYPDKHAVAPDWQRLDFLEMVTAWYDQHLKGLDAGTDRWPLVQLQGTDGQWRAEAGFPQTGGPAGQLALGAAGALGATAPTGSTAFREGANQSATTPGTRAVFETPALTAPLHLTGMPVADLWLTTDRPDGHITGNLEAIGADGQPLRLVGGGTVATAGARSLMHLDPMPRGFFAQEEGRPAPVLTPIRVPLRFQPNDLVVPAGGKLRLTIAGATSVPRQTVPSGTGAQITILHDCERPSALRFLTARPMGGRLDVREDDEEGVPLTGGPAPREEVDGGGLASAPVCGQAPQRPAAFGPERPLRPAAAAHR